MNRGKAGIASLLTPPHIQREAGTEKHRHGERMNRERRTGGAREGQRR